MAGGPLHTVRVLSTGGKPFAPTCALLPDRARAGAQPLSTTLCARIGDRPSSPNLVLRPERPPWPMLPGPAAQHPAPCPTLIRAAGVDSRHPARAPVSLAMPRASGGGAGAPPPLTSGRRPTRGPAPNPRQPMRRIAGSSTRPPPSRSTARPAASNGSSQEDEPVKGSSSML